ncbi:MAG: iron ABC transporter permease [Burkholderiales bacterium]
MPALTLQRNIVTSIFSPSRWRLLAAFIALLTLLPLLVLFSSMFVPQADIWQHLRQYVLPELLLNTFWLVLGVAFGSCVLGVLLAWLTVMVDFPGRQFFSRALLLPMALPAYVLAFIAIGLLDFTGPAQTLLREWFGSSAWVPRIRSRGGVIVIMTLAFYPYVYLLVRNAFLTQSKSALEAAQSFGLTRWQAFYQIVLPMARPWIAGGVLLVIMETCADFGTVAAFNYDTFTTAIYKTWYGLFSLPAASHLASILVMIIFALLLIEQFSRGRTRFSSSAKQSATFQPYVLHSKARWLAFFFCAFIWLIAFLIPVAQLAWWAAQHLTDLDVHYFSFLWHSLLLAAMAALLVTFCALLLSYANRRHPDTAMRITSRVATLGYALPGAVLAVGFFVPVAWMDNALIASIKNITGVETKVFLQGTLLIMLTAYLVRFLAVGFNSVDAAMQRITPSIDDAARSLGVSPRNMLARVHLPMLRGGLATAMALVFVDVMKEIPITLMTRPFGWDTLAVRIFELTSEGQWEQAALPALAIVLAGMLPIILLVRNTE